MTENQKLTLARAVIETKIAFWDALSEFERATAGDDGWSPETDTRVSDEIELHAVGADDSDGSMREAAQQLLRAAEG